MFSYFHKYDKSLFFLDYLYNYLKLIHLFIE